MLITRRTFATSTLGAILAVAAADEAVEPVPSPLPAGAEARPVMPHDWEAVLAAARGQTVNWYLWGGSESINRFVDDTYGPVLRERYGITLNRVPIADTVDAVEPGARRGTRRHRPTARST